MPDQSLDLLVRTPADTSGLDKTADSIKQVTSDAERYAEALEKMAAAQAEVQRQASAEDQALLANSAALKELISQRQQARTEAERYQATLQQMAEQNGGPKTAGGAKAEEDASWLAAMAERRAAVLGGKTNADEEKKAVEELTAKTKGLSIEKAELKKLVHELGQEFLILGQAGKAALNPMMFSLTSIIALAALAKKGIDDWNKEMDEISAKNASRDLLPGIEAKKAAMVEAAGAAARFQESLIAVGAAEDAFAFKIKIAIDKLHELLAAQAEIDNATKANELAKVNLDERLNKISPEQAIAKRTGIDEKYRKIASDRTTKGENDELALKEAQLKHDKEQMDALEGDAGQKRKQADELNARLQQARANLPTAKTKLEEASAEYDKKQQKADEAQKELERMKRMEAAGGLGFGGSQVIPGLETAARKAAEDAKTARDAKDRQAKLVKQFQTDIEEIPKVGARPESEAKIAEERATQNRQDILRLEKEIADLKATLPIRQGARKAAEDINAGTAAMDAQAAIAGTERGKELSDAAGAADIIQAGEAAKLKRSRGQKLTAAEEKAILDEANISPETMALIQQLGGLIRGQQTTIEQAIKVVALANDNMNNMMADLEKIRLNQSRIAAQTGGMR